MDKTDAIKRAPLPTNTSDIRSFLGLCNYFRSYVPNFSNIAQPLFARTGSHIRWTPLTQTERDAWTNLQTAITSRPVLAYPRRDATLRLYVDASAATPTSKGGLGAALTQSADNHPEQAIAYASRQLKPHEANYSAFLLELAAAVYGIQIFDTHLRGRHFTLFTDHRLLTKLSTAHTKTLNRLQQQMSEYTFNVDYIPGPTNVIADFLSRHPAPPDINAVSTSNDL